MDTPHIVHLVIVALIALAVLGIAGFACRAVAPRTWWIWLLIFFVGSIVSTCRFPAH